MIAYFEDQAFLSAMLFTARVLTLAAESNLSAREFAVQSVGQFVNGASKFVEIVGDLTDDRRRALRLQRACRAASPELWRIGAVREPDIRSADIRRLRGLSRSVRSSPRLGVASTVTEHRFGRPLAEGEELDPTVSEFGCPQLARARELAPNSFIEISGYSFKGGVIAIVT